MTMKKLTDRIGEEIEAKFKAEREEHNARTRLAKLWDAHVEATPAAAQCIQPHFLHASKLYGAIGSFHFKDATPEDCAALLAAFIPEPLVLTRGDYTSARPADYSKEGERVTASQPVEGGAVMRMNRLENYPERNSVEWYARIGGELVSLSVELANIHGVTPVYRANVQRDAVGRITSVSDSHPEFPLSPMKPVSLQFIRYSAASRAAFGTLLVYGNVAAYVEQMSGYCYSRRRASKKAYQEDKIAGLPPGEAHRGTYDEQKLRAGTREQFDCLNSEPARRDRALAEKHWKPYAEDYGIESTQGYFDYYAWACAYLKRQGLYEVPDPRDSTKMYKYGHAWL